MVFLPEQGHPLRVFWHTLHAVLWGVFMCLSFLTWYRHNIGLVATATPLTWATTTPSGFISIYASSTAILYAQSKYFAVFSHIQDGADSIYLTTSVDGLTWSATTTVTSSIRTAENSRSYTPGSLVKNAQTNALGLTFEKNDSIYYTTSTDGASWSNPALAVGSAETSGHGHFFSYSADGVIAIVYRSLNRIGVATSSDGIVWATSTVKTGVDRVLGFGFSNTEMRLAYADAGQAAYVYTTSSDYGTTWSQGQVIDRSSLAFDNSSGFGLDQDGHPGLVYFYSTPDQSIFRIRFATSSDGVTWSTSTLATITVEKTAEPRAAVTFIGTKPYILTQNYWAQAGTNLMSATLSTTSAWSLSVIDNLVGYQFVPAIANNGTTQVVAVYPEESDGGAITFGRSTVIAAPVVTVPSITTSTDGTGLVTLHTTVSDGDNDPTQVVIQFSTSSASGPWSHMTMTSVTPSEGTVAVVGDSITSIETNHDGNVGLDIVWDTQADIPNYATDTVYVKLTPSDSVFTGTPVLSAGFAVDNSAPSPPGNLMLSPSIRTVGLSWDTVADAFLYMVSTTGYTATTTATSTVVSGLTANAVHQFAVRSIDSFGNQSSYSAPASTSTAPAAPSSLAAVSGSPRDVDFSWLANGNADGTVYEVSNALTNEVVGTTTQRFFSLRNALKSGRAYTWHVRAQSLRDLTVYSEYTPSVSMTLSTGGSASVAPPLVLPVALQTDPTSAPFLINNGALETDTRMVTISLHVPGVVQVAVSNDKDFSRSSFQAYDEMLPWTLSPGPGVKTVFVRFRTALGATADASASIKLVGEAQGQENHLTPPAECPLTVNEPYKTADSPEVYFVIDGCTKRRFGAAAVYYSYYDSWVTVRLAATSTLASIPLDRVSFMPWGPKYHLTDPSLVKTVDDPDVYLTFHWRKYLIPSEAIFDSLGYSWNMIVDVAHSLLDQFQLGVPITTPEERDTVLHTAQ